MATTRTTKKPAKPAKKPAGRDYASEQASRVTSRQLATRLTPEEGELLDRLVAELGGAPIKSCLMAAVRTALAVIDRENHVRVRATLLKADLSPAKPGPKTGDDSDE